MSTQMRSALTFICQHRIAPRYDNKAFHIHALVLAKLDDVGDHLLWNDDSGAESHISEKLTTVTEALDVVTPHQQSGHPQQFAGLRVLLVDLVLRVQRLLQSGVAYL